VVCSMLPRSIPLRRKIYWKVWQAWTSTWDRSSAPLGVDVGTCVATARYVSVEQTKNEQKGHYHLAYKTFSRFMETI
jgi:hypothetical protein